MFLQHLEDHLIAERFLQIDMGILKQQRRIMKKTLLTQLLFILKQTDLRRGRSGIDDQQFQFPAGNVHDSTLQKSKGFPIHI